MPRLEEHCWRRSCTSRVESNNYSRENWVASKAEEMMSIITSVLSNVYGSLHSLQTANLIRRGLVLFTVGVFLALVLNLLQVQRNVTLFPEEVMATLFSSAWWIPPCCGTAAGELSLLNLYPDLIILYEWMRLLYVLLILIQLSKLGFYGGGRMGIVCLCVSWCHYMQAANYSLGYIIIYRIFHHCYCSIY